VRPIFSRRHSTHPVADGIRNYPLPPKVGAGEVDDLIAAAADQGFHHVEREALRLGPPRGPIGDAKRSDNEDQKHDDRRYIERLTLDLSSNGVGRGGEVGLEQAERQGARRQSGINDPGPSTISWLRASNSADIDAGRHECRDDDQDADWYPIVVTAPGAIGVPSTEGAKAMIRIKP
jgi:hypothetical protein